MTFGEQLQALRKEAGLSQEALAEAVGVSRQSVSKWENDTALPETDKVLLLSRLFGVTADRLLQPELYEEPAYAEEPAYEPEDGYEPEAEYEQEYAPEEDAPEEDAPEEDAPEEDAPAEAGTPKRKRKKRLIALCLLLVFALGAAAGLFLIFGNKKPAAKPEEPPQPYPYVLVHGLGGWGSGTGVNGVSRYWGADALDLAAALRDAGYEVYTPSIGPISSTWDRACELYAILAGGTVDYGAAHAAAHNHARYGRTYETPLLKTWDARHKVNLVGHSFGGETVRLLTSLLAYGDEAEQKASPDDLSPLFRGGQEKLVHSVTALCSPHNGSSLTCVLDSLGGMIGIKDTTALLATLCFTTAGLANPVNGVYDFMLDQFGITSVSGGFTEIYRALTAVTQSDRDHAGWDLSPDGAKELNEKIRLCDSVYYFSYSYCTTKQSDSFYVQTPLSTTLPALYPFAAVMGGYNGHSPGGIAIDESWQPNDGLVNVISAQYPFSDPHTELTEDAKPKKGEWNVAPTKEGHHGTVIGLEASAEETLAFYTALFGMIDGLRP